MPFHYARPLIQISVCIIIIAGTIFFQLFKISIVIHGRIQWERKK